MRVPEKGTRITIELAVYQEFGRHGRTDAGRQDIQLAQRSIGSVSPSLLATSTATQVSP